MKQFNQHMDAVDAFIRVCCAAAQGFLAMIDNDHFLMKIDVASTKADITSILVSHTIVFAEQRCQ